MSSKLRRFILPVVILVVVLVGLRTCVMLLYFMGDNFYAGVRDEGASELAKYTDATQSADRTPRWSSDGETIAVNMGDSIYAVSTDGDEFWRIPKKKSADSKYGEYSPSLSPDGRVAYRLYLEENSIGFFELITDDEGNYIESAKLDGSDVKRVAYTGKLPSNPVFSPDGSRIAFFTSEHGLTTAKSNGSNVRYSNSPVHGSEATWSIDGQRIAMLVYSETKRTHAVKTVRWDGTDVRTVIEFEGEEPMILSLDWSPDNETIYFTRREQIDEMSFLTRLYSVNSNSSDLRIIPEVVDTSIFAVSPDGSELLFVKRGGVYVMNKDGTNLRNLTSGYDFTNDRVFISYSGNVLISPYYALWSPDSSRIAVFYLGSYPIIDGRVVVLFTMARDGSDIRALIVHEDGMFRSGNGELLQPAEDPTME